MNNSPSRPPIASEAAHWERLYLGSTSNLPWEVERTPAEFAQWAELIAPGARVLDVGCGRGQHSIAMAERGFNVTGIDFSQTAVEAARRRAAQRRLVNASFEVADIIRFRSQRVFDFVYDYSVFHHIPRADHLAYRDTVARAVRACGLLALVCYAETDPIVSLNNQQTRIGKLGNVIYHPTRRELAQLFKKYFSVKSYQLTTLGPQAGHHAHHIVFSRTADRLSQPR